MPSISSTIFLLHYLQKCYSFYNVSSYFIFVFMKCCRKVHLLHAFELLKNRSEEIFPFSNSIYQYYHTHIYKPKPIKTEQWLEFLVYFQIVTHKSKGFLFWGTQGLNQMGYFILFFLRSCTKVKFYFTCSLPFSDILQSMYCSLKRAPSIKAWTFFC